MEKTLELTIHLKGDKFEIEVCEPESGECIQMQHQYTPGDHSQFDNAIGTEIHSWINLWMDDLAMFGDDEESDEEANGA